MPICYGGGISSVRAARRMIDMGLEKVAVSSKAVEDPNILCSIASAIGKQSVVGVLDIKKQKGLFNSRYEIFTHNSRKRHQKDPFELAKIFENAGAGEIVVNDVDNDGEMSGYNIDLALKMKSLINIPFTMLGGAGKYTDIKKLTDKVGLVGAAAGSLFVFKGKYRAVLINYPSRKEIEEISYVSSY
jgi:imidazole glycerol-phosphate synthase subunit HisF